jgi:hypothetical protein
MAKDRNELRCSMGTGKSSYRREVEKKVMVVKAARPSHAV